MVNTDYINYSHLLYLNKTSTYGHITEIISCLHPRFRPLDRTALLGWSCQQALHPPLSMSLCSIVHSLTAFHIININNLLSLLLCLISSSCSHAPLQYSTLSILTISSLFFFVWYCHPAVMLIININNLFSSSLYAIVIFQSCIFSITIINNLLYFRLCLILSIFIPAYYQLLILTISTLFSLFIFLYQLSPLFSLCLSS